MKKINYLILICITLSTQLFAQTPAIQHLDDAILSSGYIKQNVKTAKKAVNVLVKQLVITGSPNAEQFSNTMNGAMSAVLNETDNVNYFILEARNSGIVFSTDSIFILTSLLVDQQDQTLSITQQIKEAILANDNQAAINLISPLNSSLVEQNKLANHLIKRISAIKVANTPLRVCIRTVDNQGNPVAGSDLFGFYAQNLTTGVYFNTERDGDNCFTLLPGTYRFDSHDGYFSGTGSNTVTISSSLVNENGIIVVDLVYWSE